MTSTFLEDPADAIDRLMGLRWGGRNIGIDGVTAVVHALRPGAELEYDESARARRARQRMDDLCDQRVRTLEPLDVNRRVLVTGGAGSGKTRLAAAWARRAMARGERVLLDLLQRPARRRVGRAGAAERPAGGRVVLDGGADVRRDAAARRARRRRWRVVGHGRRRTPPQPLAPDHRRLRHRDRRRGPGLQPGLAGPTPPAARAGRSRPHDAPRRRRTGRVPTRVRPDTARRPMDALRAAGQLPQHLRHRHDPASPTARRGAARRTGVARRAVARGDGPRRGDRARRRGDRPHRDRGLRDAARARRRRRRVRSATGFARRTRCARGRTATSTASCARPCTG